ncbi:MAG: HEAT repeat domain-containing protein [Synechococcus sp.]
MQEAGAGWHRVAGTIAAVGVSFFIVVMPGSAQEAESWQIQGALAALDDREEAVWIRALNRLGGFDLTRSQQQELRSDERYQGIVSFLAETHSDALQASALRAIAAAGHTAEPTSLKVLPLLQDSDGAVRQAAIDALAQLQARRHLNQILPLLYDGDVRVRQAAILAVGRLGGPQHALHLRPFLFTPPDPSDSTHAALLAPVDDGPVDLRLVTVAALAELEASDYRVDLVPLLLNSSPQLRQAASHALGQLGADDLIPEFLRLLEDPRWQAREAASQTLGLLGSRESVQQVMGLLQHPSWPVRQIAIQTLVRLNAREAIPSITSLLSAPEAEVRAAAATALGQMGGGEDSELLLALLHDDAVGSRQAAVTAIGRLGEPGYGLQILELLGDRDSTVRQATLHALAQLNARETTPQIVPLLRDSDADVRQAAVMALGELEAQNALPQLLQLLTDESVQVQQVTGAVVAQLLQTESIGDVVTVDSRAAGRNRTQFIETIPSLLHHRQWTVRQTGLRILGQVELPERIPLIVTGLRDRRLEVRQTALSTWEQLCPHTVSTIAPLLETTYDLAHADRAHLRFSAYYGSGGRAEAIVAIQWLGKPSVRPAVRNTSQRIQVLEQLYLLWPDTAETPHLRSDLAQLMAQLVSDGDWASGWMQGRQQRLLLGKLEARLRQDGFVARANTIRSARSGLLQQRQLLLLRRYLIGHAVTWLMLWLLYPLCLPIQILVWHPWLRRILGHIYIGYLLARVPFLRSHLLVSWGTPIVSKRLNFGMVYDCEEADRIGKCGSASSRSTDASAELDMYDYRLLAATGSFPSCELPPPGERSRQSVRSSLASASISASLNKAVLVSVDVNACERGVETAVRRVVAGRIATIDLDPAFFSTLVRNGAFAICIQHLEHGSELALRTINTFAERYSRVPILLGIAPSSQIGVHDSGDVDNARLATLTVSEAAERLNMNSTSELQGELEDGITTGERAEDVSNPSDGSDLR